MTGYLFKLWYYNEPLLAEGDMLLNTETAARRFSVKKGVLKNFAKFTGKHLCQGLFLIKLLFNKLY